MVLGESEHKQGKKPELGRFTLGLPFALGFSSSCVLTVMRLSL